MVYDPELFAEKYQLAWQSAVSEKPQGGLCGFELEWNLLDSDMRPLLTVGAGHTQQSFVDYLRPNCLPPWVRDYSQLEVFHWMIEWATRPYYHPRGAVYEGRLMEAVAAQCPAQSRAAVRRAAICLARQPAVPHRDWPRFDPRLLAPGQTPLPGALRRSVRRQPWRRPGRTPTCRCPTRCSPGISCTCPPTERGDLHLDEYKSQFYITATRLMRAFAALFIATSASTPLAGGSAWTGKPVVRLTEVRLGAQPDLPEPAGAGPARPVPLLRGLPAHFL